MNVIVYVLIAMAAVIGALSATYRIRQRQRFESKLDRIIELLERGAPKT